MLNAKRVEEGTQRSRDILNFIALRLAGAQDVPKIAELLVHSFSKTYASKLPHIETPQERLTELRDVEARMRDGQVVVLELGYRIIGTAAILRSGTAECESWLENAVNLRCLAIDPEFHGLRFSEALLNEAESLARAQGADYICLHVQEGAEGVARLYTGRGFMRDESGDAYAHGHRIQAYFLPLNERARSRIEQ